MFFDYTGGSLSLEGITSFPDYAYAAQGKTPQQEQINTNASSSPTIIPLGASITTYYQSPNN